jgi:hypothetical protein
MSMSLTETLWHDWPAYHLENGVVRVLIVPALGGKLAALDSLRTGRSWLWRNRALPVRAPRPDRSCSYEREYDLGGWDEILPTVHPCTVPGTAWGEAELTDHGVLWCRPWRVADVTRNASGGIAIVLEIADPELPFRFTRALRLSPQEARFGLEYRIENRGDRALPYVWAAHPLIPLEPGMRVELPPGTRASCAGAVGGAVASPQTGSTFVWPEAPAHSGGTIDLGHVPTRAPGSPGRAVKVFTERLSEGWVRAIAPDRSEAFTLTFRTE